MKNFGICYSSSKSDRHPLSGDAATHDTEIGDGGMQPHAGAHAGMRGREHLALFSQDERQQFRTRMHEARSPEERRAIREEMHQQYRQRAAANPAANPPASPVTSPAAPATPGG